MHHYTAADRALDTLDRESDLQRHKYFSLHDDALKANDAELDANERERYTLLQAAIEDEDKGALLKYETSAIDSREALNLLEVAMLGGVSGTGGNEVAGLVKMCTIEKAPKKFSGRLKAMLNGLADGSSLAAVVADASYEV